MWEGEEWGTPVVVLDVYRGFWIVLWREKSNSGYSVSAIDARPGENIEVTRETNDFWAPKTVQKYINLNKDNIERSKQLVDEELDIEEAEKS